MFDILLDDLKMMTFHTELLEVCHWDEEYCDLIIQKTIDAFNDIQFPDIPCTYRSFVDNVILERLYEENLSEEQVSVIIKIVDHNAEYITKLLSLPEN